MLLLNELTQNDCIPATLVFGTGAVGLPVPPVELVYQRKLLPDDGVAVRATAL